MPARIERIPQGQLYTGKYRVVDDKGKIHAAHTTKEKAEAQARLLNAIAEGKWPQKKAK